MKAWGRDRGVLSGQLGSPDPAMQSKGHVHLLLDDTLCKWSNALVRGADEREVIAAADVGSPVICGD